MNDYINMIKNSANSLSKSAEQITLDFEKQFGSNEKLVSEVPHVNGFQTFGGVGFWNSQTTKDADALLKSGLHYRLMAGLWYDLLVNSTITAALKKYNKDLTENFSLFNKEEMVELFARYCNDVVHGKLSHFLP